MAKTKSAKSDYTIGIDLGGTKLASGLVDQSGKIFAQSRKPTVPPDGTKSPQHHIKYIIKVMADTVEELRQQIPKGKSLHSVGLASAGPMNVLEGKLLDPPNFA